MRRTALLVIDVQRGLVDGAYRAAEVLGAIAEAQHRARIAGAPIVFLQHCHATYAPLMRGAESWAIHPAVGPQQGDLLIEKRASDGFWQTNLAPELRRRDITHLVIAGLQTEFCVDATCRAAFSRNFDVTLIADGHTTGDDGMPAADKVRHHNYVLRRLAHPSRSISVVPAERLIFEHGVVLPIGSGQGRSPR